MKSFIGAFGGEKEEAQPPVDHLSLPTALKTAKPRTATTAEPNATLSQKDVLLMLEPFRCLRGEEKKKKKVLKVQTHNATQLKQSKSPASYMYTDS